MKIKYLLAAVVLGLVFLYSACAVNAQSLSVADQIKALQEQIVKLQEQLLALSAEQKKSVTWCHTFNVDLRPGDGGSGTATETEVQNLQIALEKEGFAVADAEKSAASFGESTAAAVVGFQEKYRAEILGPYGLAHGTGLVLVATRTKLNKLYGCGAVTPAGSELILKDEVVSYSGNYSDTSPSKAISFTASFNALNMSPSKVVLNVACPAGVTAKIAGKTASVCGLGTAMEKIKDGQYNIVLQLTNTTSAWDVKVSTLAKAYDTSNNLIATSNKADVGLGAALNLSNFPPEIASIKGPSSAAVGEKVNFYVNARDPEFDNLRYSVNWGDGTGQTPAQTYFTDGSGLQAFSACHTFSKARFFIITFYVQDNFGNLAKSTTTILVGSLAPVPVVPPDTGSITIISPLTNNETWKIGKTYEIMWYIVGYDANASVRIYLENGGVENLIASTTNNSPYKWIVPSQLNGVSTIGENYRIRVKVYDYLSSVVLTGTSNNYFKIAAGAPASINVSSPNGGEVWQQASLHTIGWSSENVSVVSISLLKGGVVYTGNGGAISGLITNLGSFQWTIPLGLPQGNDYKIRVTSSTGVFDDSDTNFGISAANPWLRSDCSTHWDCTPWSSCVLKQQNRTCIDTNNCGVSTGKPEEVKSCCATNADCETGKTCSLTSGTCVVGTGTGTGTGTGSTALNVCQAKPEKYGENAVCLTSSAPAWQQASPAISCSSYCASQGKSVNKDTVILDYSDIYPSRPLFQKNNVYIDLDHGCGRTDYLDHCCSCKEDSCQYSSSGEKCVALAAGDANQSCENYCNSLDTPKTNLYANYLPSEYRNCTSTTVSSGVCCMCKDFSTPAQRCSAEDPTCQILPPTAPTTKNCSTLNEYASTKFPCCPGLEADSGNICKKPSVACTLQNYTTTSKTPNCCDGLFPQSIGAGVYRCVKISGLTCMPKGVEFTQSFINGIYAPWCCSGLTLQATGAYKTVVDISKPVYRCAEDVSNCVAEGEKRSLSLSVLPCCSGLTWFPDSTANPAAGTCKKAVAGVNCVGADQMKSAGQNCCPNLVFEYVDSTASPIPVSGESIMSSLITKSGFCLTPRCSAGTGSACMGSSSTSLLDDIGNQLASLYEVIISLIK